MTDRQVSLESVLRDGMHSWRRKSLQRSLTDGSSSSIVAVGKSPYNRRWIAGKEQAWEGEDWMMGIWSWLEYVRRCPKNLQMEE